MSRLNKSVATATGRLGVGVGKRLQEIPELMPQLGFLPLQDVVKIRDTYFNLTMLFCPKVARGFAVEQEVIFCNPCCCSLFHGIVFLEGQD